MVDQESPNMWSTDATGARPADTTDSIWRSSNSTTMPLSPLALTTVRVNAIPPGSTGVYRTRGYYPGMDYRTPETTVESGTSAIGNIHSDGGPLVAGVGWKWLVRFG